MHFKCIATGSKGNCYTLTNSIGQVLMLDCGISWKEIKRSLAYRIDNIVGCLVTHSHRDHCISADEVEKSGIATWKPYEVSDTCKRFGDFTVIPFSVPHDGTKCFGFFIKSDGMRLIYATDFEYLPVNFRKQNLNHIIIECNYTDDMLVLDEAKTAHVIAGHAGLETVKRIIEVNRNDELVNIILVHGSALLDDEKVEQEIQFVAGTDVNVFTARAGFETELNDTPF